MSNLKSYFKQLFLLNKRLWKKRSFLAVCTLMPLLALGMHFVSKQDSGVMHILLYATEPLDAVSEDVIEKLLCTESVLHFERVSGLREAYQELSDGNADAVWIFSNTQGKIEAVLQGTQKKEGVVTVVERMDTVALHLAREKLFGVLYPYLSYELFANFIEDTFSFAPMLTEEELRPFYEAVTVEGNLFRISYAEEQQRQEEESSYLLMPLRGLLVVVLFLCGIALVMYVQQDRKRGMYLQMSGCRKFFLEFGYYVTVTLELGLLCIGCFWMTGIKTGTKQEFAAMLLYSITIAGICCLLRRVLKTAAAISVSLPICAVFLLVCSPIFWSSSQLLKLQRLLPTYHYLYAVQQPEALHSLFVYTVIVLFTATTVSLLSGE